MTFFEPRDAAASKPGTGLATEVGLRVKGEASLDWWDAMCMTCGKIGCCDSSPNRHASRHASEASHPIMRSAEPGEDWSWCVVDEVAFVFETGDAA
jgi:hypothetical protein